MSKRILCLIAILISGCNGFNMNTSLDVTVSATGFINPDQQGHASPVVVELYQLSALTPFQQLSYQKLLQEDGSALGSSLIEKQRIILRPGNRYHWQPIGVTETRYIGVVVGYREWVKRQAQRIIAVKNNQRNQIHIQLKARGVSINAK